MEEVHTEPVFTGPKLEYVPRGVIVTCDYDPYPIDKIPIDAIRQTGLFDTVAVLEKEAVLVKAQQKNITAHLQLTKLVYKDDSSICFKDRDFAPLYTFIKSLPPLSVRTANINFILDFSLEDKEGASLIRDTFLKDAAQWENKLGQPIISHSVRLWYGDPGNYYDLRVMPTSLLGKSITIHLRKQKDMEVIDSEKLITNIELLREEGLKEVGDIYSKVFGHANRSSR